MTKRLFCVSFARKSLPQINCETSIKIWLTPRDFLAINVIKCSARKADYKFITGYIVEKGLMFVRTVALAALKKII